ncbi:hypothetical protein MRX96_007652 [Rhipicephalus microplus]
MVCDDAPSAGNFGLHKTLARIKDRLGDRAVTQMLFRLPENPFGLDLFAIDIERGRDHGTASYAAYVQRLFGITLSSFDDLYLRNLMPREVTMLYADLYEDVQDIDLFTAGMNEPALPGGDVGRTFAAIIAEEFRRLKLGDRFYYEHGDQAGSFSEVAWWGELFVQQLPTTMRIGVMASGQTDVHKIAELAYRFMVVIPPAVATLLAEALPFPTLMEIRAEIFRLADTITALQRSESQRTGWCAAEQQRQWCWYRPKFGDSARKYAPSCEKSRKAPTQH